MDFSYVAYTKDRSLVKGKVSAQTIEAARGLINQRGYNLVSIKQSFSFDFSKLNVSLTPIKPKEIVMFSRQMALLLESGTDIVASLELLQSQVGDKTLRQILAQIVIDIRGGSSLSAAMRKHPKAFGSVYHRAIAAGEASGNMEIVLRQMADFIERQEETNKKIKGAMSYPIIVAVVAVIVVAIIVVFVLPTFMGLYESFNIELPGPVKFLMGLIDFLKSNGIYLLIGLAALIIGVIVYFRTPKGKYHYSKIKLKMPVLGRIVQLTELSRVSRTISLLFKVGLPLPDILSLAIAGTDNKVMSEALIHVQHDLIRGEGLSKPMKKNSIFLPLMVQMVA
ncbi:MAG: type II secretion system F family protein, partial [Dehalococcoidales bacterium]|nr:type II secretion system F family protein [Dehalococcoidales bacterium]